MIPDEESLRYILLNVWKNLVSQKRNRPLTKLEDLSDPINDLLNALVDVIDILVRLLQDQLEEMRIDFENLSLENQQLKKILTTLLPESKFIKEISEKREIPPSPPVLKEHPLLTAKPPVPSETEIFASLEEASRIMGEPPLEVTAQAGPPPPPSDSPTPPPPAPPLQVMPPPSPSESQSPPPPPPPESQSPPPPPPPESQSPPPSPSSAQLSEDLTSDSDLSPKAEIPEPIPDSKSALLEEIAQFAFKPAPQPIKTDRTPPTPSIRTQLMNEIKKRFEEKSNESTG
ncbi:MAG: hypothetical protein ACFFBD_01120 [Candidatus Hodarchaeota archaeon]